jgi:hypothetical protein
VPNDNVSKLIQPGCLSDQCDEILRQGARTLLAQVAEAEVADFLASMPISRLSVRYFSSQSRTWQS